MRPALLLILLLTMASSARADEQDDLLANQLTAVVRDPRYPLIERVEAAKMLTKLGPKASVAVPQLIAQLQRLKGKELASLQEAVVEAIGAAGSSGKTALPILAQLSGRALDIDIAIKRTTREVLAASDAQDVELLVKLLRSQDAGSRLRGVKGLALLGRRASNAIPALTNVLQDTDGEVRRGALAAIRKIDPEATPAEAWIKGIVLDLKDPDPDIRLGAVRMLGRMGAAGASAATALEGLASDPDKDVRRAAVESLQKILVP